MNKLGVLVTAAATCLFFKGGAAEETCWEQESSTDTCPEGCWFDDGWTYDTCETCSSGSDDPNNECDVGQQSGFSPNCYIMDSSSVGCCSGFRESGVSINGVVHCIRKGMDDQLNGGTRNGLYCGSQSSFTNVCNMPSAPASSSSSPSPSPDHESNLFPYSCDNGANPLLNGCCADNGYCPSSCSNSMYNSYNGVSECTCSSCSDEEDKCMGETKKVACRKISGCLWEQGVCQMAASEPADVCMAETKAGKCRKTSGCLWKNGECVMVADEQTDVCVAETKARKCRKISGCLWKNGECLMVADEQTDLCMAETKKGKCRKISGCFWEQGECHIAASEPVNVCMSETKAGKCRKISGCSWKKGQCFMDDDEE